MKKLNQTHSNYIFGQSFELLWNSSVQQLKDVYLLLARKKWKN
jgi:hypothetical protein